MADFGVSESLARVFGGMLLTAFSAVALAGGPLVVWPGAGNCAGTLQACINAASAGSTIEINSDAVIDESLALPGNRVLSAAEGRRPRLAPGRGVVASFSGSASADVRIRGLSLTDARVRLVHSGTGSARFEVTDCDFSSSSGQVAAGIQVELGAATAGRTVTIARNQMEVGAPGLLDAGVSVLVTDSAATLDIRHNRIRAKGITGGSGIKVDASVSANVVASVFANEVSGAFGEAMAITEGRFSATPATLSARIVSNSLIGGGNQRGGGLRLTVGNGEIEGRVINNTVVFGLGIVINRWSGSGPRTGVVSGSILNNLIAYAQFGLQNTADAGGTASNDYNLKFANNPPGLHTPGANDLAVDPRLRSPLAPRPVEGSPAINAGNGFALFLVPELADTDADGLRRTVGPVDIGAYEFGHASTIARKTSSAAVPDAPVLDSVINADSNRRLFATRNFALSSSTNPNPVGVSYFDQWLVVNSNGAAMPQNSVTNVFAPLGNTNNGVIQHVATGSNTLDGGSVIDWSLINGAADWIVLLTQSTAFGTPFHPGPTVLDYVGSRWNVRTANGSSLLTDTRWNLYAQRPSPQAFVHTVSTANQLASTSSTYLDHPLLNGVACAQLQVTALARGIVNGSLVDTEYDQARGRHRLFSNNGAIPIGARYHVLVLPAQIDACVGGPLFLDGFDGSF